MSVASWIWDLRDLNLHGANTLIARFQFGRGLIGVWLTIVSS